MSDTIPTDYARWGEPQHHTVQSFLALTELPSGLYVVDEGGLPLSMLVTNHHAEGTFVGFHAAMNPELRRPLPFFQGRRIAPSGLNAILLSDPSLALHESVMIGWFLGNRQFDLPTILPKLLDHADQLMGATKRLLWGTSAGGTAAMLYARPQDIAVAVNPQTIVQRFTRGRWMPWTKHGWGIEERADERSFLARVADLTKTRPHGRIVYVQNRQDEHLADHWTPFAAAHGLPTEPSDSADFRLVLGDWGGGHTPPPPHEQAEILREESARMLGHRQSGIVGRIFGEVAQAFRPHDKTS